jgi:YggT family protein
VNPEIARAFEIFLYILIALIIVRAFMSWFPSMQGSEFARFVHRLTEPLIEPVRRFMPAMGGFDLSPIVVIIVLNVMIAVVRRVSDS